MPNLDPRLQDRLRVLSEVVGAFADATIDYDRLLDTIARKLAEVVGDLCSVLLLTEDGGWFTLAATHDLDPDVVAQARAVFVRPIPVVPVQRRVLDTGDALVIPRISPPQIRDITTDERAKFTQRIGMHSVLLVALRVGGNPIGVLNLVRHDPQRPPYDDTDRDLAQTLADHAAVAITNARLLRQQHEQLRLAKEAAESASRELEAFSYSVAHDLRTPLRAISGHVGILNQDFGDRLDAAAKHSLRRITTGAEHMGQLIDALLDLSRVSRTQLSQGSVNLTELAQTVIGQLRAAEPTRVVEVVIGEGLRANGDEPLLRALLDNLLGNAWKFSAERAPARIELGQLTGEAPVYFVRDNGAGFDLANAERLFAPFQRFHSASEFPGTGIGLATAARIVRRHGGRIWAEAAVNQGATFFFTLAGAQPSPA